MQHRDARSDERVDAREFWRWVSPWLWGALLVATTLLGLFTASRAQDGGAYAVGFVTAGLSVLALVWRLRRAFDGGAPAAPAPVLVDQSGALGVVVGVLTALAVAGLLLAARGSDALVQRVGYALFAFSLVFIFWNMKHYFDQREHGPPR